MSDYDLFVIGAGSGGVRAARMSAAKGAKVGIAEDRYLGGTCVNVGCVPKKLLVYAAGFPHAFHAAESFGWHRHQTDFDWQKLIDNKNQEISRLNNVYEKLLTDAGVELIHRRASLVDSHTVNCDGKTFSADKILIATGGWPHVPEIQGSEHIITSNEAFFLEQLPESITIVGGGYIAVEFAGIFNGLGVDTTLLYRGSMFLRGFDQDIREHLAQEMQNKGIHVQFNTNIKSIHKIDNQFEYITDSDSRHETSLIMYATGRKPNTSGLGLEQAGVSTNQSGAIEVNEYFQTSNESIYAIGDVIDRVQLTPVALAEGMYLANHLFGEESNPVDYSEIPTAVFSQPDIGTVGLTEEEARKEYDIVIYLSRFTPMKYSLSDIQEKILMKLIVDAATDKVLGVHMVGPEAGEIIQGMAIAIKCGARKSDFDRTIGIHPTSAEEFVTMRSPYERNQT